MALIPLILMISFANAQNSVQEKTDTSHAQKEVALFSKQGELGGKAINTNHADKFGHLLVQDFQGRIKPMDAYIKLLRKL